MSDHPATHLPQFPIHPAAEVSQAIHRGEAVAALESNVLAHGLPTPLNLKAALRTERLSGPREQCQPPAGRRPTVRIVNGFIDEPLTSDALMQPGIGDFRDRFSGSLT